MYVVLRSLLVALLSTIRTRASLQLEILALRHQLGVLQRIKRKRIRFRATDRLLWVALHRLWPDWRRALMLVKPETVISWHRKGFRFYWRWKSRRPLGGRPATSQDIRKLIRDTSSNNVLWGAPRVHGELLKLGIEVSQATVAKYMLKHRKPPAQTWRTFLENRLNQLASVDFFVVPTLNFRILYVFLVLAHERRRVVHFNVTEHPTGNGRLRSSCRHSPGIRHPGTFCATVTGSMATLSRRRRLTGRSPKCSRRHDLPGRPRTWNG